MFEFKSCNCSRAGIARRGIMVALGAIEQPGMRSRAGNARCWSGPAETFARLA